MIQTRNRQKIQWNLQIKKKLILTHEHLRKQNIGLFQVKYDITTACQQGLLPAAVSQQGLPSAAVSQQGLLPAAVWL